MIFYAAHRRAGKPLISRVNTRPPGDYRELLRRHDLIHPDGDPEGFKFDWGYVGPAARHLALAMLSDATTAESAVTLADRFVRDVLLDLGATWVMGQQEVKKWVGDSEEHDRRNAAMIKMLQNPPEK